MLSRYKILQDLLTLRHRQQFDNTLISAQISESDFGQMKHLIDPQNQIVFFSVTPTWQGNNAKQRLMTIEL